MRVKRSITVVSVQREHEEKGENECRLNHSLTTCYQGDCEYASEGTSERCECGGDTLNRRLATCYQGDRECASECGGEGM